MTISEWDEYLIHQIPDLIHTVGSDDPHFMDRMAFVCHNFDGTLYVFAGLGSYPNVNVMDGFFCVREKHIQHNLRVSRHLCNDRAETKVGPLYFKVMEPLKSWAFRLEENEYGIEGALEFNARAAPYLKEKDDAGTAQNHYNQVGVYQGTVSLNGRTQKVLNFMGVRDRSWGPRPPDIIRIFDIYFWIHAHFDDFSLSLIYLDSIGGVHRIRQGVILQDDGGALAVVDVRHHVEFEPGTKTYKKITLLIKDEQGNERTLICSPLSAPFYMAGAGYDGRHGRDCGAFDIRYEKWDVNDIAESDPSRFIYSHRIAAFQLGNETGNGLIESTFGWAENWEYRPTL